jgi:hypothetical protein
LNASFGSWALTELGCWFESRTAPLHFSIGSSTELQIRKAVAGIVIARSESESASVEWVIRKALIDP